MTAIFQNIYKKVEEIPYGQVASYKQVAQAAGLFRGAQVAGWALKALPGDTKIPWQRVINQKAQISIINPKFPKSLQKDLLEAEGVEVIEADGYYKVKNPPWYEFKVEP